MKKCKKARSLAEVSFWHSVQYRKARNKRRGVTADWPPATLRSQTRYIYWQSCRTVKPHHNNVTQRRDRMLQKPISITRPSRTRSRFRPNVPLLGGGLSLHDGESSGPPLPWGARRRRAGVPEPLVRRGPQGGERRRRRRRRLEARRVLRERVPPQVQRRLEAAAARGAHHRLRLVDEPHVLAQVGRVGVAPPALRAPHARRAARARAARAARCQQHHVRTAPSASPPPHAPLGSSSRLLLFRDTRGVIRRKSVALFVSDSMKLLFSTASGRSLFCGKDGATSMDRFEVDRSFV